MADKNRELGFRVVLENVPNEAQELAKLIIQFKNLNKEINEFEKLARKGIASKEQIAQLASLRKELDENTRSQQYLKKVIDSAPDSLNRMRADLIKLKYEYANASTEVREKMAPAINQLNSKILS